MTASTTLTLPPSLLNAYLTPTTTIMNVLQNVSQQAAQEATNQQLQMVQTQLQNQYNQKIADVEDSVDTSGLSSLQAQITTLGQQASAYSTSESQYGGNINILADLQTQLASLQTAAGSGDSADFDAALANANQDVSTLTVINPGATFQSDGVNPLKVNGLGITDSASYDLSTPDGQAAAAAAVSAAVTLVNRVYNATAANQSLAGAQVMGLSQEQNTLNSQLSDMQSQQSDATANATAQLQTQMQNQLHLIELELGRGQQMAQTLSAETTALQNAEQPGSIFSLLA